MALLFPPLRPHFDAALRDQSARNPRARALAAESLGEPPQGREHEAKEALRRLIDDPMPEVRGAALVGLGRLRDVEAIDAIVARFEDGDPTVRQLALIAAADLRDERAIPALRRALGDERPELRFQAVASIATIAPANAVEVLAPRVDDPDVQVRAHLADALGSLERPEAAKPLARLLKDDGFDVRLAAAIGLARIGDPRGVDALIGGLEDKERCFEAAWALGELREPRSIEPLAKVAQSFLKPLAVKAAAAAALVRLGDARGAPALREVLRAFRSDARSYAAQLVGELRLVDFAADLAALSRRPRGADPVVVVEALAKLAPLSPVAREALEACSRRGDEAGAAAKRALAERPERA